MWLDTPSYFLSFSSLLMFLLLSPLFPISLPLSSIPHFSPPLFYSLFISLSFSPSFLILFPSSHVTIVHLPCIHVVFLSPYVIQLIGHILLFLIFFIWLISSLLKEIHSLSVHYFYTLSGLTALGICFRSVSLGISAVVLMFIISTVHKSCI